MKNMFGEPIPTDIDDMQNLYDLLKAYKSALMAHQKTAGDIDVQMKEEKTPEIRDKREQLKKCEAELAKVEKELGVTNDSLMNHSRDNNALDEDHRSGADAAASPAAKSRRPGANTPVPSIGRRSATPNLDTPPSKKSRR